MPVPFRCAPRRASVPQLIGMLCAGSAFGCAHAQQPATPTVVEVTGTLIRGAAPVGAPVLKLDRAAIEKAGVASTGELLRLLPQMQNLGADEGHTNPAQNANQNITLGSGLNLRGLGPESTLTLVSGQRMAPGGLGAQYTDPSSIPAIAIERMEVIADGGSATYGSDAVGGVVNIQLRRRYRGVGLSARVGAADGMHQRQFSAIAGHTWQGGQLMAAAEVMRRGRLAAEAREFYTDDLRPWGGPDLRGFGASPGNIQIGATRYGIPAEQDGRALARTDLKAGAPNLQSIHRGADALPRQERNSAVFNVGHDLSEGLRFNAEAIFSQRDFVRYTAAQATNATVRSANPFFVSANGTATSEVVNYSFLHELGTSRATGFERTYRYTAGLTFDLSETWAGSAFVGRGGTVSRSLSQNLNGNAINAALADTDPATSLNLFCDANRFACNNPATLARIRAYNDRNATYRMVDAGVKFDGPLFDLPAGTVRLAVGGEVQRNSMDYFENRNNSTPDNATVFHIDNAGRRPERTVRSLYVETLVPLAGAAQGLPWMQRLDLSLAARSDDYSDFGRSTNPRVGLDWTVSPALKLYASHSKAFRAPTLGDIDPVNAGLINVVDRVGADGRSMVHGLVRLGGREGLKPERATIATLGAALQPLDGMKMTLDYFRVDYQDRILTPGNDTAIFAKPELSPYLDGAPDAAAVAALMRDPTFSGSASEPVSGIRFIQDGRRFNAGVVKTSGIDLGLRYERAGAWGRVSGGLLANYVLRYKQQFTPSTPLVDGLLNTLNNPVRLRARADAGWSGARARANLFANFTNRYTNAGVPGRPEIACSTTWDFTGQLDLGALAGQRVRGLRASLSVLNLFDRKPPYVQNGQLAFDPQNASAIGRMASLSLDLQF